MKLSYRVCGFYLSTYMRTTGYIRDDNFTNGAGGDQIVNDSNLPWMDLG